MSSPDRREIGPNGSGATSTLAVRGAGWTGFGVGAQRVIQTLALVVLARLMTPEDFGLMALAMLFLTFANRLKSLGLQTALLQFRGDDPAAADTLFLINLGVTAVAVGVIVAVAGPAATWFGVPGAGVVLSIMALRLVPQAVAAIPAALAAKALRFRRLAFITVAESVASAATSIALALHGWAVGALVAGSISGAVVAAVAWWCPPMWRPRFRFHRDIAAELIGTGFRIWSSAKLAYVIDSANRVFMGRFLGVEALGIYDVTSRLVHAPIQSLFGVYDRVAVPAFCREQDDVETLRRWLVRLTGFLIVISALAACVLFFFADVLIPVIVGSRWDAAVGPVRALAPFVLLVPLLSMGAVYIATGRVGTLLRFTAVRAAVTIAGLFWASHVSLVAVCSVESAAVALFVPVNLYLIGTILEVRMSTFARVLAAPAGGVAAFSIAAVALRGLGLGGVMGPAAAAVVLPLGASIAFAVAVFVIRPGIVAEGRRVLAVALGADRFD